MKRDSVFVVVALLAGFLGGSASNYLFNARAVEAAGPKSDTFDTITANHIVVNGAIVINSSSAPAQMVTHPFVITDDLGNAFSLDYAGHLGYVLSLNTPATVRAGIPAALLSNNGLALLQLDPTGGPDTFTALLSPTQLALGFKTSNSGSSTVVQSNFTTLTFSDANPKDTVHTITGLDGFSYEGNGTSAAMNKFGVSFAANGKVSKWP